MKLHRLHLANYRCFANLEVILDPTMTVIVAENGQGKSALLDAVRVGLWPYINGFDLARSATFNDPANGIAIGDVRQERLADGKIGRQLPSAIRAGL